MINRLINGLIVGLMVLGVVSAALNPTVTISQAGADDGTVIFGKEFTVTLTVDESANEATISFGDYDNAFSVSENRTRSMSGTSISWTVTPVMDVNNVQASVRVTSSSSGATGVSNAFDVVSEPNLKVSSSPASLTVSPDGSYVVTVNVQNWGETSAKDVVASISLGATGMSLSTGVSSSQSLGVIQGGLGGTGESKSASWVINAGSTPSSGVITITVTSSNADSRTDSVTVTSTYTPPVSSGSSSSSVSGFASVEVPTISVTCPDSVELGAGETLSFDVLINNTGSVMMNAFNVNFTSDLTVSVNPSSYSYLMPEKSVNTTITITAGEPGNYTGNLTIKSNNYDYSKTVLITVTGESPVNINDVTGQANITGDAVYGLDDLNSNVNGSGVNSSNESSTGLEYFNGLLSQSNPLIITGFAALILLLIFKRKFFLKLLRKL